MRPQSYNFFRLCLNLALVGWAFVKIFLHRGEICGIGLLFLRNMWELIEVCVLFINHEASAWFLFWHYPGIRYWIYCVLKLFME